MTDSISFPHLGITLEHVGRSISIGGFEIAYYGIVIALAMLFGLLLAMRVARWTGQDPDLYFNFAIIAIVLSVCGARIYYVAFSWEYYGAHSLEIFNLRGGGLAIYGGVLTAILTALGYARYHRMRPGQLLDTGCTGLILGQIIGRWGNFFNREAFGGYTDGLLAMRLPLDAIRAQETTARMLEHALTLDGVTYVQVHPTFLYESLWNLGVLGLLLAATGLRRRRGEDQAMLGGIFCLYLIAYGTGRIWIEGLRTDQLLLPGTRIPVSQLLSALLVTGALLWLGIGFVKRKKQREVRE